MKNYISNYPRPQLTRDNFLLLDGIWDFRFDYNITGESSELWKGFRPDKEITVPYTYETVLSGINNQKPCECVWYQKKVNINNLDGKKILIHFEGSDYETTLWVNGKKAGSHKGGYSRFSFDITDLINNGENLLVVEVKDSFDKAQPRGKQRWLKNSFDCFYVQTTGIWKSVWIEFVPEVYISSLKITPVMKTNSVKIEGTLNRNFDCAVEANISFDDEFISSTTVSIANNSRFSLTAIVASDKFSWPIKAWSPEAPNLYDLNLILKDEENETIDSVGSYFGMREIRINGRDILLNGTPLYQRLILDQGYWHDSHLTPPDENAIIEDIDKIMALGYNGVRKHMKVEDEKFLYWADVKGLLVWSEFPATYIYCDDAVENFTREWMSVVRQNYSHPSIITWTPFNESWGVPKIATDETEQKFTEAIYYLTKSFDPMRPVVCNDGWEHTISDILTLHDYEENADVFAKRYSSIEMIENNKISFCKHKYAFAEGFTKSEKPVIISEFGGIAFQNDQVGWGYGNKVQTEEDFIERFKNIVYAIRNLDYCSGFCYTQVSDVQQEINGLMDEERNFKIDPDIIKSINLGTY